LQEVKLLKRTIETLEGEQKTLRAQIEQRDALIEVRLPRFTLRARQQPLLRRPAHESPFPASADSRQRDCPPPLDPAYHSCDAPHHILKFYSFTNKIIMHLYAVFVINGAISSLAFM
jgi:hypothetical protein